MAASIHADEQALRDEIVRVCRLMYQKNLIAPQDGNVSARWGEEFLLITPSGCFKGELTPDDLIVTDLEGRLAPESVAPRNSYRPSGELYMHLEAYRQRSDVRAVVHGHPPLTTACTVAGVSLSPCVLPETLVYTGTIVTTAYASPSSPQGPIVVRELIRDHDALVLDRHGALAVGKTPLDAFSKLEKIENTALVTLAARLLGGVKLLPVEEVRHLAEKRAQLLDGRPLDAPDCARCGACAGIDGRGQSAPEPTQLDHEALVQAITEQVLRRLRPQEYGG